MLCMNKLEFSLLDSESIGVVRFSVRNLGFPPFDAFLIIISMGKRCIYSTVYIDKE